MPRNNSTNWSAGNPVTAEKLNDFNDDIDNIYSSGSDRMKVWHTSGLDVQVGAGNFRVGVIETQYAGGTFTLGDNTTTYIFVSSIGNVTTSTVGWGVDSIRLAIVVTSSGTVTSISIWRHDAIGGNLGLDINGLTEKLTQVGNDILVLGDSEAGFIQKKIPLSSIVNIGGNGSDGALTISSGTTTIPFDASGYVEKNYTSFTMTGGTLTFSGATNNGSLAVIKVSGDFTFTGGTIHSNGMGASEGNKGYSSDAILSTNFGANASGSSAGIGGNGLVKFGYKNVGWCGSGGGNGLNGGFGASIGGRGGGMIIIEVGGKFIFSSPASISCNGLSGTSPTNTGGVGGGGGGSIIILRTNKSSYTGLLSVNGGNGTQGQNSDSNIGGGGGGAGYSSGGNGSVAGVVGNNGVSNAYGTGGIGGASLPWKGAGGGGGAGFYYVN